MPFVTLIKVAGPVLIKLNPNRLKISNNGGFIGGITPYNILHHQPASRNPLLVEALTCLRLVNRSSLGISRIYNAFLIEDKDPPNIQDNGESILVAFPKSDLNGSFRLFVAEESSQNQVLDVDELLLIHYLLRHPEIDSLTASRLCHLNEPSIREKLLNMESNDYIVNGGKGRGTYWFIHPDLYTRLSKDASGSVYRPYDWHTAKKSVLRILAQRDHRNEPGLSNKEIRKFTHLDRNQVYRMMKDLQRENKNIQLVGHGRNAKYRVQM